MGERDWEQRTTQDGRNRLSQLHLGGGKTAENEKKLYRKALDLYSIRLPERIRLGPVLRLAAREEILTIIKIMRRRLSRGAESASKLLSVLTSQGV